MNGQGGSGTRDVSPSIPGPGPGKLNVVVGAINPLGRALIDLLTSEAKPVRGVVVDPRGNHGRFPSDVEVVRANPLKPSEVIDSCKDASVIYDCFEPSGSDWKRRLKEVTSSILLAAIESGSILAKSSHLHETDADNASIEKEVTDANSSSLARTVVVRMPQMYGPGVINELWKNVFGSVAGGKKAHWVGDPNVPRSFLYVADAARSMELLSSSLWAHGRAWNVPGPGPLSGKQLMELTFQAADKEPRAGVWGRGIMLTGWLLASQAKEFLKLPYDYYKPFVIDGSEFTTSFPSWKYTTHEEAVKKTLEWYGSASKG